MASTNPFLNHMRDLVREEEKILPLTTEASFPYLLKVYQQMSANDQRSREILISEILKDLNHQYVTYWCEDQASMAYQICDILNKNGIPAETLNGNFRGNITMEHAFSPGIILRLYR